jgi:hypothetical protein
VQSSAGALKQLQGQVLDQKRSAEVAHTGQLEARERLVGEMETTARKAQLVVSTTVDTITTMLILLSQLGAVAAGIGAIAAAAATIEQPQ